MADPETSRLDGRANDHGPLYTETPVEVRNHEPYPGTIAEPWNAATASLFVWIVVFWAIRLRGRLSHYPFMAVALPILFVGGVGGTLYHGFRNWQGWFLMDVIPISLLGLVVSIYFWIRLGPRIIYLISMIGAVGLMQLLGQLKLPTHWAITVSYATLGILILTPLIAVMIRTRFKQAGWIAAALVCFGLALYCRLIDPKQPPVLPMGTHWLWHTFGAGTTAALSEYVYRLHGVNLRSTDRRP